MQIPQASDLARSIVEELRKVVVGQDDVLTQVVVALMAGGHGLVEGVPGTAKTLIARALSMVTGASFRRIQFTPDLLPADITGVNTYHMATGEFVFRPGPLFADIVLADEVNRAPAKTQAALLEAMQERQVTVDGEPHPMSPVFTVFATQNPVEFEGTYPLPEAQVDRFMLKILIDYPGEPMEASILDRVEDGFDSNDLSTAGLQTVVETAQMAELRGAVRRVRMEEEVRRYVTAIVRRTRRTPGVSLGASPRAGIMLMLASKARALISGREFTTPDDVKEMARPALRHRLLLEPEVEVEGRTPDQCVDRLLTSVEVPR